ncbi:hypothetical protein G3578_03490 [Brevibacillus sp. SYP-B805]|jgi:hypothetical protein|uniref:hypothetical protein n=1 Tax=Brevibacillus sp. SYP-B805 TaxID=1578199 RepID=UPI0013ECF6C9|nr:hypothetical protein [Brevibacillus sp. SYP-B805]NGQ94237.1 hypothetical protein [Brevibacillus sp. SYP-B805]
MTGRGLLGVILTSGLIAGIGYMLLPQRKNRFTRRAMKAFRWALAKRNLGRWGRMVMRSAARFAQ